MEQFLRCAHTGHRERSSKCPRVHVWSVVVRTVEQGLRVQVSLEAWRRRPWRGLFEVASLASWEEAS